jgi:hypothetical protein
MKKNIYSIVVFIFTIFLFACTQDQKQTAEDVPATESIAIIDQSPIANDKVPVVAIDLNHDNKSDEQSLLNGSDAILLYDSRESVLDNDDSQKSHYHFFTSNKILALLDETKTGYIDYQDSAFPHFKLLIFHNNGAIHYIVPAYQAGIRAIFFKDPSEIKDEKLSYHPNQVLMSDGSTRNIYIIFIDQKYLAIS